MRTKTVLFSLLRPHKTNLFPLPFKMSSPKAHKKNWHHSLVLWPTLENFIGIYAEDNLFHKDTIRKISALKWLEMSRPLLYNLLNCVLTLSQCFQQNLDSHKSTSWGWVESEIFFISSGGCWTVCSSPVKGVRPQDHLCLFGLVMFIRLKQLLLLL